MRIAGFDVPDLVAGLLVVGAGGAIALGASSYPVGRLARMGPGFLPLVVGILLAVLGLALVAGSRMTHSTVPAFRLRPPLAVFAGLLFWALTVEPFGLVPATVGLVVIASLAQDAPRVATIAATAIVLVAFSLAVFVYALRMPIPAVRF